MLPKLGLATKCTRFPKKLPDVSQKVAQKWLQKKSKVAQKLLKIKQKTIFVSLVFYLV